MAFYLLFEERGVFRGLGGKSISDYVEGGTVFDCVHDVMDVVPFTLNRGLTCSPGAFESRFLLLAVSDSLELISFSFFEVDGSLVVFVEEFFCSNKRKDFIELCVAL